MPIGWRHSGRFASRSRPRLVFTEPARQSLGIDATEPVALELAPDVDAATILALVADAEIRHTFVVEPAGPAAEAAIELVKLAQVLPAVLVADTTADRRLRLRSAASSPSRPTPWRASAPMRRSR